METTRMKAQHTALSLPEILEQILFDLDHKSLLTSAQRVCRLWHDLVSQPSFQRHLFFEPDWNRKDKATSDLLVENFPILFQRPPDQPGQLVDTTQVNTIELRERPFENLPISSPLRNESFMYEDASWRRMLVQQPPILDLITLYTLNTRTGTYFNVPNKIEKALSGTPGNDPDFDRPDTSEPLRMGRFYDEITSDLCFTPRTFMIMWNKDEFSIPPKIDTWTFQEEDKMAIKMALEMYGMVIVAYKIWPCSSIGWAAGRNIVFNKPFAKYVFEEVDKSLRRIEEIQKEMDIRRAARKQPRRRLSGALLSPIYTFLPRRARIKLRENHYI